MTRGKLQLLAVCERKRKSFHVSLGNYANFILSAVKEKVNEAEILCNHPNYILEFMKENLNNEIDLEIPPSYFCLNVFFSLLFSYKIFHLSSSIKNI